MKIGFERWRMRRENIYRTLNDVDDDDDNDDEGAKSKSSKM